MVTESDLMRKEISQLQEQVQNGYKKIKNLNEIINKQRDKIFRLEGQKQLEFEF
tara:strand:+ start:205 stop:366 length:162 start_codon:yes stop_codon:yes gene_type:complete